MSVLDVPREGLFQRAGPHCLTRTEDRGCNPGLVATPDGVVFVDTPQRPSDAKAWLEAARRYGPPLLLVNTEHHMDHCAGNGFFDVPIVAHEGTKSRFFDPSPIWGSSTREVGEMFRRIDPDAAESLDGYVITPPQVTFADDLALRVGEVEIRLVNLPGHLPNSTVVHIPQDGVVFMSDNLFVGEMPWLHEADPRAWIRALDTVKGWAPRAVVPGHGPVSTPAALDTMRAFLVDVVEQVEDAIAQGQSADETAKRLNFLDRFVVLPHLAALASTIQHAGIVRTHHLLSKESS
jgi:cyclase